MLKQNKSDRNSNAFEQCVKLRETIRHRIGRKLCHVEHFIYGLTYVMIGFTEYHWLYYAFGFFVFFTIAFGEQKEL